MKVLRGRIELGPQLHEKAKSTVRSLQGVPHQERQHHKDDSSPCEAHSHRLPRAHPRWTRLRISPCFIFSCCPGGPEDPPSLPQVPCAPCLSVFPTPLCSVSLHPAGLSSKPNPSTRIISLPCIVTFLGSLTPECSPETAPDPQHTGNNTEPQSRH